MVPSFLPRDTSGPNPARLQSRMVNLHLLPNNDVTEVDGSDAHRMIGTEVEHEAPVSLPAMDCLPHLRGLNVAQRAAVEYGV